MLPISLLEEHIVQADGTGPVIDASHETGRLLVLTLGITRIIEQESLEVSIWGSSDGANWGLLPLATFPQKSYCGLYSVLLNLVSRQEIQFLRAQWKVTRWSRPGTAPMMFSFYVTAEESGSRVHTMAVA